MTIDLMLGDQPTLSGCRLPALRAMCDENVDLVDRQELFLTESILDAAVLRSVGLHTASAFGLNRLGGRLLDHFYTAMNCPRRIPGNAPGEMETRGWKLVLVGWRPTSFQCGIPPAINRACRHLRNIERCLNIKFDSCRVWCPSLRDRQRIMFAVRNGKVDDVQRALLASCAAHALSLGSVRSPRPKTHNYGDTRREWYEVVSGGDHVASNHARHQVNKSYNAAIVEPLLRDAEKTDDTITRLLLTTLADISAVRHDQSLSMAAAFHEIASKKSLAKNLLPSGQFAQQQLMLKQLLAITEALSQRRRSRDYQR